MIPADIGPHPDAPNHYISFAKPADWSEEDCGTLTVRRVAVTGDMLHEPAARIVRDDLPSGECVYPAFLSQWVPSADERKHLIDLLVADERKHLIDLLVADEPIAFRLLVAGNGLPPMSIWLKRPGEV